MFEGNYQLEIQVEAHHRMIQHERKRRLRDIPRPERRGTVWDAVARFGSMLVRLGTSMERFALVDEKVHVDV